MWYSWHMKMNNIEGLFILYETKEDDIYDRVCSLI